MNRNFKAYWLLSAIYCLAAFLIVAPIVVLLLAGFLYLAQNDLLVTSSIIWLALALICFAAYKIWPVRTYDSARTHDSVSEPGKSGKPALESSNEAHLSANTLPQLLSEKPQWSKDERQVWLIGVQHIESLLASEPTWDSLPGFSLQLLSDVANCYTCMRKGRPLPDWQIAQTTTTMAKPDISRFRQELRFSLPELLLVVAVAGERYRQVILKHVPFAEKITVATAMKLYEQQGSLRKGARWINNIRRTARLINPVAALTAELREHFTQKIFTHASEKVQTDLKRLLMQELMQVAMDLNSGRLTSTQQEISEHAHSALVQDEEIFEAQPEPLRIVLLGQVSSGKSSLLNALAQELRAETDILPSTDKSSIHVLTRQDQSILHIMDTAGLENRAEQIDQGTQLAVTADIVIHVVKATQPARSADKALVDSINHFYTANPLRRRPPDLMVMTHVDQLSPKSQWEPPYDMTSQGTKAQTIKKALSSAQRQIGLPDDVAAIPVCLSTLRGLYNVDAVMTQISWLESEARQSQLNRRRIDLGSKGINWSERWTQLHQLGRVLGQSFRR